MSNQFVHGRRQVVQVLRAGVQGQGLGQRKDMAMVGMEESLNPWAEMRLPWRAG